MIDIFWTILISALAFGFAGILVIAKDEKQTTKSFVLIVLSLVAVIVAWAMLIRYHGDISIMLRMKGYEDTEVDKLLDDIKADQKESYTDEEITDKIYYYLIEYTRLGNYEPMGDDAIYYNKIMKERNEQ